jgi:DNA polymerase-3 subunit delta'
MAKRPSKPAGRSLGELREEVVELPPAPPVRAPIPLAGVLGQDRAVAILERAIRARKVHHAWIFEGPLGVGKFTTALAFAAMLLDDTTSEGLGGALTPDPDSRTQVMLRHGSHPDLVVVTKELGAYSEDADVRGRKHTTISVDVVREFMLGTGWQAAQVARPDALAAKVFIIDESEMLNEASQNSLLKFLEEPPPRTVLMLVCNNPETLLPTIRSRCQRVALAPLTSEHMRSWLKASGLELDPAQHRFLLDFAAGSPGALKLCHETGIAAWWQRLEPLLSQAQQGKHVVELGPLMHEMIDAWAKARVEAAPQSSKEAANHAAAAWMLRLLAWEYASKLRGRGASPERTGQALSAIDAIREADAEVDANVNTLFVFDKLAAVLARPGG